MEKTANIRQILTRRCAALGIPVSGIFELTPRCNLQCKMCYVRLTPNEMARIGRERTAEEWIRLAQEAKDAGMAFLLLTGGEPTLRDDFCEIYQTLAQMGFSISINTNGTLLSPALRAVFHRWPPAQVNVTLYGTSREDYAQLCGDPGAFDAVVDGLRWLKAEGILIHLNTTMTPVNRHKWLEIEEFAKAMDLELRMTTYCFPPVRRETCGACEGFSRLSPEDAAALAAEDLLYREGPDGVRHRLAEKAAPREDGCSLEVGEPMGCLAGRSQFWVTWDGRMSPCGMLDFPVAMPFKADSCFAEAWSSLNNASLAVRLCPDCVQCEERNTCLNCAAVTYTETGRLDGKPEYMCRYNKAYRAELERLAKHFS